MKKLILLAALIPNIALGATTGIYTYEIPTFREDGAILNIEEITGYQMYMDGIEYGDIIPPSITSVTIDSFPNGRHCITSKTIDTDGQVSAFSTEVCGIGKGKPLPPQNGGLNVRYSK